MKKLIATIAATTAIMMSFNASAYTFVNGYVKSNGTYVAPHIRTSPDSFKFNNFSY